MSTEASRHVRPVPGCPHCVDAALNNVETYEDIEHFVTVWDCYPPPLDVKYRVTKDEWNEDRTVRTIKTWAVVPTWPPHEEQR